MPTDEQTLDDLRKIVDAFEEMKKYIPKLKKHIGQQSRQPAWSKKGKYKEMHKYGKKST